MASNDTPGLRVNLLPDNVQVTQYNAENGAIREVLLDGHYAIHGYDPDLQGPEVRERYEHISQVSMSALVLRSAGVELQTTLDVLDANTAQPDVDHRLGTTFFAVYALGQAFRTGLIDVQIADIPESKVDISLTPPEIAALNLLSNATIMLNDRKSWGVLAELRGRYPQEPNLLSIYTKALASEIQLRPPLKEKDIQHVTVFGSESSVSRDMRLEDLVQLQNMKLLKSPDPQLKSDRQAFIRGLANGGIDLSLEAGPRKVIFKGREYTFDFPGARPSHALCFTLRLLGLDYQEIAELLPDLRNHKSLANKGMAEAGVPVGVEPILSCIANNQVTFLPDLQKTEREISNEQLSLFQYYVQYGVAPRDRQKTYKWHQALRYAYAAFGGTNRREAALVAATRKFIHLSPEDKEKARTIRKHGKTYTFDRTQGKLVDSALPKTVPETFDEEAFEQSLANNLSVAEDETSCTITWRGLKVNFDFRDELLGDAAAIAAAGSFGVSVSRLQEMLPEGISQKRFVERHGGKVGFTQKTISKRMNDILINGYARIDTRNFTPVDVELDSLDEQIVARLGVILPQDVQSQLSISRDVYYKRVQRLCHKYGVPDYPRLVWTVIASGQVPSLAHLTLGAAEKEL